MIQKIPPILFDWIIWRNGSPLDVFGLPLRQYTLSDISPLLRKYAIGYCKGESLVCRPKINHMAVMFFINEEYYWFHFTNEEFTFIFNIYI